MALKDWKKEFNTANAVIFRNKKNTELTFEIHEFDKEFQENTEDVYYCFPALNGKGIPNTPHTTGTKKEALEFAKKYMETH